jgi:hypothetical protein
MGYSGWVSSTGTAQGISSETSIPPPTNLQVVTSGSNYDLTWTAPTGTDYNGNPLAQSFEVQKSSTGLSGSWTTIATVPGSQPDYTTPASSTSVSYFRVVTNDNGWLSTYDNSGVAQPASSLISTSTFPYSGSLQNISAPSGTQYIAVTASGAGGGGGNELTTYGGSGDLISARIPVSGGQSLVVLVGGGGIGEGTDSGSGGGLTGVFNGTPSQSTALLIAGAGGGGANDYTQGAAQLNGSNGSLTPTIPAYGGDGLQGGPGYGGGGGAGDYPAGYDGTPFGAGGPGNPTLYSTNGGYGGGASGGQGWGGGGGGSGYVGGQGGGGGEYIGSGGEGGTSYAVPTATHVSDQPGYGGAGGYGTDGANGHVTISFYS